MRKFVIVLAIAALLLGAAAQASGPAPVETVEVVSVMETNLPEAEQGTPEPEASATVAVTEAPTAEPTAPPEPTATSEPTPEPTPEPTATPEPTLAPDPGHLMSDCQPAATLSVGGIFSGESTVLGSDIPRSSITSIRFEASLSGAPEGAWDVSEEGNGSVLAWVTDGALTIAGEGGVRANANASQLFAGYSSATSIDFNGCFSTEGATDMSHMFESCWSLTALDASALDTSSATDLSYMFSTCPELTALDVTGFDTSRAVNMEGMFLMDSKLESIDLSNFDTANVSNMRSMFESCTALRTLDLSAFQTAAVTDARWMFNDCASLERVILGPGFGDGANASGMFDGCAARISVGGREMDAAEWSRMDSYAALKKWDRGDGVRWLQTRLSELGYNPGSIDGVYGPNTEAALIAWQQDHGYEANGALDSAQVWALIQ